MHLSSLSCRGRIDGFVVSLNFLGTRCKDRIHNQRPGSKRQRDNAAINHSYSLHRELEAILALATRTFRSSLGATRELVHLFLYYSKPSLSRRIHSSTTTTSTTSPPPPHKHVNTLPPPPPTASNAYLTHPSLNSPLHHPRRHALSTKQLQRHLQSFIRTTTSEERTYTRLSGTRYLRSLCPASRERRLRHFATTHGWKRFKARRRDFGTLKSCQE